MKKMLQALFTVWQRSLPGRILERFNNADGNLLASGMSYTALFTIFAIAWLGLSALSYFVTTDDELWISLMQLINNWVPNLIDTGYGGAINPDVIRPELSLLTWTSIVAFLSLVFTSLGWLDATRAGILQVFGANKPKANPLLQKLTDLGLMLGFGMLLLVAASASVFSSSALQLMMQWFSQVPGLNALNEFLIQAVAIVISIALNFILLLLLFWGLARLKIKFSELFWPVLVGAIVMVGMQLLASVILAGVGKNPLLATFAVVIGLLIWFNLVSRLQLFIAAWLAEVSPTAADNMAD